MDDEVTYTKAETRRLFREARDEYTRRLIARIARLECDAVPGKYEMVDVEPDATPALRWVYDVPSGYCLYEVLCLAAVVAVCDEQARPSLRRRMLSDRVLDLALEAAEVAMEEP